MRRNPCDSLLNAREMSLVELHRNDRVKMPSKPEWGMGRVLQEPAAGKVSILFREAGE
jgi:hypothetical protein